MAAPEHGPRGELPAPLTPSDCDLRDCEPPWALFVEMAVAQYGVSREEAQAFNELLRAEWLAERNHG